MRRFRWALVALVFCRPRRSPADKRFPEAKSGKGELKYVNGVPVLTVEGTPEEIGTQFGELALKPAKKPLIGRVDSYMKQIGWEKQFPDDGQVQRAGLRPVPEAQPDGVGDRGQGRGRRPEPADGPERRSRTWPSWAAVRRWSSSRPAARPAARSSAGYLDWPPFEELPEYTLVIVFRPKDKHAFAAVTFPVLLGACPG